MLGRFGEKVVIWVLSVILYPWGKLLIFVVFSVIFIWETTYFTPKKNTGFSPICSGELQVPYILAGAILYSNTCSK